MKEFMPWVESPLVLPFHVLLLNPILQKLHITIWNLSKIWY